MAVLRPDASASLPAVPAQIAREAQATLDAEAEAEAIALADEGAALAGDAGLDAEGAGAASIAPAWRVIIDVAEERDAAVVVVGSRGRSPVRSAVLGSVSTGVLHHCRRPVLVVQGT